MKIDYEYGLSRWDITIASQWLAISKKPGGGMYEQLIRVGEEANLGMFDTWDILQAMHDKATRVYNRLCDIYPKPSQKKQPAEYREWLAMTEPARIIWKFVGDERHRILQRIAEDHRAMVVNGDF